MGDRLIAASSAYKRAPADSSEPVLIDALPSIDRDLPDHSGRDDPPTLSRLKGSLRPHVLVAERAVPVRLIRGPRAVGADGSDVAKLRQRRKNRRSHEELSPFAGVVPFCRGLHISWYRRPSVCGAARSGTCDERERERPARNGRP